MVSFFSLVCIGAVAEKGSTGRVVGICSGSISSAQGSKSRLEQLGALHPVSAMDCNHKGVERGSLT